MPTSKKKTPTKKAVVKKNARQEVQKNFFEFIDKASNEDFLEILENINANGFYGTSHSSTETWCERMQAFIAEEEQAFNNKRLKEIEAKVKKSGLTPDDLFFYINR